MDAFRVFLAVIFVLGAISAYKTGIVHSHQKKTPYIVAAIMLWS